MIAALARELAPALRRARGRRRAATRAGRFVEARLGGRPVILGSTGDGAAAATLGLRALLERRDVGRLVFLGVAGGLSPALDAGDLVIAGEVRDAGGAAPPPDRGLLGRALAAGDADASDGVEGLIYTSDRIVGTSAGKAELWRALGEPAGAVVDLETAAWARVAAERAIPYVAVRAVSDAAVCDLPLDFERYRDARGRVRSSRVAFRALFEPSLAIPLRRLQKRVDRCAERLASWTISYLA